jgi:integrase
VASLQKRGKQYYVRLRDETGRQRSVKAGPDKSVANQIKRDLESKIAKLKAGVLDPREADAMDAERVPISRHVADYIQNLEAKGYVPEHVENVRKRLGWFLEETTITRLSQLRPSLADSALATLRDSGRSDQTVSHYATCWKSFTKWAWKDRRTRTDLLADLEPPKVVTTSKRSALPGESTARLIETTRRGPRRRGMTGEDRAWLYTLAAITGLRRKELQSLVPESFSLDGNPAVVSLPGRDTKNSDEAIQPLPAHVVPDLRSWLANKGAGLSLWPWVWNTAEMLRSDLKAAGIDGEAYCFHSLRHTYVSAIVQCGGSVKDSMELARHHDADLTFNRYAHSRLSDLSQVVDRMPDLLDHTAITNGGTTGLNRTTANHRGGSPDEPGVDPLGHDDRLWEPMARRVREDALP